MRSHTTRRHHDNGKNATTATRGPIGVLAVQGDFDAHATMLERLGAPVRLCRSPGDFERLSGIVLPGGESSTMLKLLNEDGLMAPLRRRLDAGVPVFGTCAGMILMARTVAGPAQDSLGILDIGVLRNGYGRQVHSFVGEVPVTGLPQPSVEGVFIRAPVVTAVGRDVEVMGSVDGAPVMVRQGRYLATSFHPELTSNPGVHGFFLSIVASCEARADAVRSHA